MPISTRSQCRKCGVKVVNQAAYCHACGAPQKKMRRRKKRRIGSSNDSPDRQAEKLVPPRRSKATAREFDDDDEISLWEGTFSAKGMANSWCIALLVTLAGVFFVALSDAPVLVRVVILCAVGFIWLALGGVVFFRKLEVHYELTNQRLIHKYGILRRTVNRIEVIDVDDIVFEQGVIERILGVGTIVIVSSDKTDPIIEMPGVDQVYDVAQQIDEARRAERIRRGIHIEAV